MTDNVYETQKLLDEYLHFHFGADNTLRFPGPKDALDFPLRCARLCLEFYENKPGVPSRALDIGCAVGRSTFELARELDEAMGTDYSHNFVNTCNKLKKEKKLKYQVLLEGELTETLEAVLDPSIDTGKTSFFQGDACDLPRDLGKFGCVLAANLICRLHTPNAFLDRLAGLVAQGGVLVITSPYTFLKEYTPRENWIGGYVDSTGETITGLDGLKSRLGPDFDLVAERNMPFLIRETARKHQWTVAHATVWRRK